MTSARLTFAFLLLSLFFTGCSTSTRLFSLEDMEEADISADSVVSMVPNYTSVIETLSGRGRALVSQPGSSDRVTLQFHSNRDSSLLTVRNSVGIEGAEILVNSDSLLIYNKIENYAEKASLRQSNLSSVGSIASVNMLDLFNFTFAGADVKKIFENESIYGVVLQNSAVISLSKTDGLIQEVIQPPETEAAYSRIVYEGYAEIQGFYLPRKITIFSSDRDSRATFLVQQLEVNGDLPSLDIELPQDIPVYRP